MPSAWHYNSYYAWSLFVEIMNLNIQLVILFMMWQGELRIMFIYNLSDREQVPVVGTH